MGEEVGSTQPLTQTQPAAPPTQAGDASLLAVQGLRDVAARLISVTKPGYQYEIRTGEKEVVIGRHPKECQVKVDDKRVSAQHCRLYRDEAFHWFVEELSSNCCYINEHLMRKGDTRALRHGDELSLCVNPHVGGETKPFAAFIFRVSEHDSGGADSNRELAQRRSEEGEQLAGPVKGFERHFVDEVWLKQRWDMRTQLGSGNFSEVRLGVHVGEGHKRAVKVIDVRKFLSFQSKRESQLSLLSEVELLTTLEHPGIVRFYEWFQTSSSLYVIMELMEGGDLLQSILEDGCFAELQARRLFREVCCAVRYLHEKSVVHRDLKPENILLTSKDREVLRPKVADFGLARVNQNTQDCKTFCGTPHYFAPEVISTFRERGLAAAGEARDPAGSVGYGKTVDMWSLGVILYVLLSGMPPFEEEGLYEQILEGRYEFDVREFAAVSPEAKELVVGLMTVNPRQRLSIQQALDSRWLRLERDMADAPVGGEPAAKKPRCGVEPLAA